MGGSEPDARGRSLMPRRKKVPELKREPHSGIVAIARALARLLAKEDDEKEVADALMCASAPSQIDENK